MMSVKIESSSIVKPSSYNENGISNSSIPLTIFDKTNYNTHVAIIYVFRSTQNPPNSALKLGLETVLSEYREWAGRLGVNDRNEPVIFLNDQGVRFIEAVAENQTLDHVIPYESTPLLFPSIEDVPELVQVQLTRFSCGSLVVGFTAHHHVADGYSSSNFLVAWGKASRGLDIGPLPTHDRSMFMPREPPRFEFEHLGFEFITKLDELAVINGSLDLVAKKVVVKKLHFTLDFINKLKAKAAGESDRRYSTFESLMAHLWRTITIARGLEPDETTQVRISVNGRRRLNPRVSDEYFGNLVLWAFPRLQVTDLVSDDGLSQAVHTIHESISKVNDSYFRSFIDFAAHKVEEEDLVTSAVLTLKMSPNVAVQSWVGLPFYDLDFGGGIPTIFMPATLPIEGMIFILPSFDGEDNGSIDAFVHVFEENLAVFDHNCYNI